MNTAEWLRCLLPSWWTSSMLSSAMPEDHWRQGNRLHQSWQRFVDQIAFFGNLAEQAYPVIQSLRNILCDLVELALHQVVDLGCGRGTLVGGWGTAFVLFLQWTSSRGSWGVKFLQSVKWISSGRFLNWDSGGFWPWVWTPIRYSLLPSTPMAWWAHQGKGSLCGAYRACVWDNQTLEWWELTWHFRILMV